MEKRKTENEKIIVTGAGGQIGTELVEALRALYGLENVLATDIDDPADVANEQQPYERADVLDKSNLERLFQLRRPTQVYHLAALLSAVGEQDPGKAWELNMKGLFHVLELSVKYDVKKVFWPSSIAVFGPGSPRIRTPQECIMDPRSVYGISKLAGERWCEYYFERYGLDVRSLRFPGLIGWKSAPGGGTTDYAVHIFHEAIRNNLYSCFLSENTRLPMMAMPDAIRAAIELMQAEKARISVRSSYNVGGMSFTPGELTKEIRRHLPGFRIHYTEGDPRQHIADSWPESVDDSTARNDWGWAPRFDLPALVAAMLQNIGRKRTFAYDL